MSGKTDKILKRMKWAKEELYSSFSREESDRIYLSIKDAAGEEFAFDFMERFCIHRCKGLAKILAGLMHVPGMKDLFVRIWDPMTRKMIGPASGFTNRFYDNPKGEYRMDVTSCPYSRYLKWRRGNIRILECCFSQQDSQL